MHFMKLLPDCRLAGHFGRSALLLALWLFAALPCMAYEHVAVLVSSESAASDEFVRTLKSNLEDRQGKPVALTVFQTTASLAPPGKPAPELIIAVGVQALQQAAELADHSAVLGVLIPYQSYQKIRDGLPATSTLSAITLDQPLARQFALLHRLLPSARAVGVLLGPSTASQAPQMARIAQAQQLKLIPRSIDSASLLPSTLGQLLQDSDVLLTTPDPLVYTRDTAQTILLTSYRYQKPVIGFSKAYVTAGALAAVYSTPEQVARQAAEIITKHSALPLLLHPQYFSVATNRQVARSLGITIDSESLLADKIRDEETSP